MDDIVFIPRLGHGLPVVGVSCDMVFQAVGEIERFAATAPDGLCRHTFSGEVHVDIVASGAAVEVIAVGVVAVLSHGSALGVVESDSCHRAVVVENVLGVVEVDVVAAGAVVEVAGAFSRREVVCASVRCGSGIRDFHFRS